MKSKAPRFIFRTKGKRHPLRKPPVQRDTTVGVRFAQGPNINRVFTYRVRLPHPYKLGDPVVVDARGGMCIAFIVRIDAKPQLQDRMLTYKWIRHQIKELWQEPPFDPDSVANLGTVGNDDEDESV